MDITPEEKLMYDVMKAIYESGIPINFKGSMVLKACLIEAGYLDEIRHTVDIDANWYSDTPPTAEQMVKSLQNALDKSDINLRIKIYRMYGEGRSAGFELLSTEDGEVIFTMDVDVNRPATKTKIYEIGGVHFCGATPVQMISDKVASISSDIVFRRIKDVIDLYYISHIIPFNANTITKTLKSSGRVLGNFYEFLYRTEELKHSYEKFRFTGVVNKPTFEEVYRTVKQYINDILPEKQE